jgi:hypothetical protein
MSEIQLGQEGLLDDGAAEYGVTAMVRGARMCTEIGCVERPLTMKPTQSELQRNHLFRVDHGDIPDYLCVNVARAHAWYECCAPGNEGPSC